MNIFNFFKNSKKKDSKNIYLPKNNNNFFEDVATINNTEGFYGFLKRLPNPDPILRATRKGIECLRSIEQTGQVATCVSSRNAGVTSLNWRIVQKNDKYKEFYDDICKHIDIYDVISSIIKAPAYGYQPIEIVWAKSGANVIPDKIIAKPQEWFFFNAKNELCFKQRGKADGLVLRPEEKKFLCPTSGASYLNPYGIPYLSRCFWDVAFIKGGVEFWTKFNEKYGMPYLIGKYEEGSSDEKIQDLLQMLNNMVQDAVAVIPDNSTFEIKEASGKTGSADLYEKYIRMFEQNISKNILGQTLTTDIGSSGSYAAGKVHAAVRADIVASDARIVEKEINKLLCWVHELNFGDSDVPVFEFWEDRGVGKDIADRDRVLVESGVKFSKKYFLKTYNFEDEDIEVSDSDNGGMEDNFAEKTDDDGFHAIDEIVDTFSDEDFEDIISDKISPIIKDFAKNKNPGKAMERLSEIFPKMDSDKLEKTLTKCLFFADLLGRASK